MAQGFMGMQLLTQAISQMKDRQNALKIAKLQADAQKAALLHQQALTDQQDAETAQILQNLAGGGNGSVGVGQGGVNTTPSAGFQPPSR